MDFKVGKKKAYKKKNERKNYNSKREDLEEEDRQASEPYDLSDQW